MRRSGSLLWRCSCQRGRVQSECAEIENMEALQAFNLLDAQNNSHWEGKRKELFTFIKNWDLQNRELQQLATDYGIDLTYLAPFWSGPIQ